MLHIFPCVWYSAWFIEKYEYITMGVHFNSVISHAQGVATFSMCDRQKESVGCCDLQTK